MSGMAPGDFFHGFVLENLQDWEDEPDSIRKAFNAAVSAFHLADHYFRYYSRHNQDFQKRFPELKSFQIALTERAPSFRVIQDMATAYKHLYTRASCSVASGGSIESVNYSGQTIEQEWQEDNGTWAGNIVIRRRDQPVIRFAQAIRDVIEMWNGIMYSDRQPAL